LAVVGVLGGVASIGVETLVVALMVCGSGSASVFATLL
jgi:hypothetical protein